MLPVVHRRHVAAVRRVIDVLLLSRGREDQARSDPPPVGRLPLQRDLQIVMGVVLGLHVLVDEGRSIDVVHHDIELAVVIEIGVRRPVRKARPLHPPCLGAVGERQVTLISEHVVGRLVPAQLIQDLRLSATRQSALSASARPEHGLLVIQIRDRLGIAVGDEDVLVAVIVEISEQGAPAPVGVRHARQAGHVAEDDVPLIRESVVQLERVDAVVDAKPLALKVHDRAPGREPAHALSLAQGVRHHVHLEDVGTAVIIEIRDIDPHAREAGMFEPRGGLVGERPVAVVDVQDVVRLHVVRDVDVGPPIAVQVGDRHAESVTHVLQYPGLPGHVGKGAVAVVAVQPIVAAEARTAYPRRVSGTNEVFGGIVEQKQVEVPVAVVIEEDGVGGEPGIGDPVPRGGFGEGVIPVVDEKQIGAVLRLRPWGSGHRHVDIEIPVVVDVHHRDAGGPSGRRDPRRLRDVLEPHVALVQVQAARDHVAGKENVRQAIVIDVAHGDAGAVVDVDVGADVEGIAGRDGVGERDAGLGGAQELENGRGPRRGMAAAERRHDRHERSARGKRESQHGSEESNAPRRGRGRISFGPCEDSLSSRSRAARWLVAAGRIGPKESGSRRCIVPPATCFPSRRCWTNAPGGRASCRKWPSAWACRRRRWPPKCREIRRWWS